MSFKDSMIRGFAMYGLSSMSQYGSASSKVFVDLMKGDDKDAR